MTNINIKDVNFSSKTKEQLSEINSVSGNKSEGAKKRWFRTNNPDINALMTLYKDGDTTSCMEKYMSDNEKFMALYKEADNVEQKRKVLRDYQAFQLKIHELMFGSKIEIDANVSIRSLNVEVNLSKMAERYIEWKSLESIFYPKWVEMFGEKQAQEMKDCLMFKYQIDKQTIKDLMEMSRKDFIEAGFKHYEKNKSVTYDIVDNGEYEDIKQEVEVVEETRKKMNKTKTKITNMVIT